MANFSKLSIAGLAIASASLAVTPAQADMINAQAPTTSESPATQTAQAGLCRQVSSRVSALNVRSGPSVSSPVVGVVAGGRNLTLDSLGAQGWVPISAPLEGYVAANYLTLCDEVAEPVATTPVTTPTATATACRQVTVQSGLNVRAEPDRYSNRLTALPTGTNVQTGAPETEHWVYITEPVDGYVAKRFLGPCY